MPLKWQFEFSTPIDAEIRFIKPPFQSKMKNFDNI